MTEKLNMDLFIPSEKQGTYFTLPFTIPPDVEAMQLLYRYERHRETSNPLEKGSYKARQEVNIIDLGLIAPDGTQVGASGSDKTEISLSATGATPGYTPRELTPGKWQIIVGAYKVAPEGVKVTYEITFTKKHMRLLKGDLHTHTIASDGVLTASELGWHAVRHGLDFIAVTDHNQLVSTKSLPQIPGLTILQGVEWTHYQGHANFLGMDTPYDGTFISNTPGEAAERFNQAHDRGALIVVNHPMDEGSGFKFDMNTLPFDCLEIWNGPMRESNLRAVGLWQHLLTQGLKIPAVGGSDYHRDNPFQILGGPTTCVYAMSASTRDILDALKAGHAFITFFPNGPTAALASEDAIMGDSVQWTREAQLKIEVLGLLRGDVLRVVTGEGSENLFEAPANGNHQGVYKVNSPGFARVEVLRAFLPGLPLLPALITNPVYFDR